MKFSPRFNFCITKNRPEEVSVQDGLAYTPADMSKLTSQGRAIKLQETAPFNYHDGLGVDDPVPLELKRGVDENILWNRAGKTQQKLLAFKKEQKNKKAAES